MVHRNARRLAVLVLVVTGCASAPSKFYALQSTASSSGGAAMRDAVIVGPVSIPASVDRPEFVVQVAENRVQLDEFNRWISPLDDAIARTVSGNLAAQLGTPDVATAPLANFQPVYRVTIDVQRFASIPGEAALLEAVWVVRRTEGGAARSGRTVAREPVQGDGFDALAAAHSRALETLSLDIASAIRSDAAAER
jgi:uncharacterized lipoprotein YmbA